MRVVRGFLPRWKRSDNAPTIFTFNFSAASILERFLRRQVNVALTNLKIKAYRHFVHISQS